MEFVVGGATMLIGVAVGVGVSHVVRHGLPPIARRAPPAMKAARNGAPKDLLPEATGPPPPSIRERFQAMPEFDRGVMQAQVFEEYVNQNMDDDGKLLDTSWMGT